MGVTRRQVLMGGGAAAVGLLAASAGFALVEERILPGKTRLDRALGACGTAVPVPHMDVGERVRGSFVSKARAGRTVTWTVVYPAGFSNGQALPVCVALPGRGGTDASPFDDLHFDRFLAAAVKAGHTKPYALASADGGASVNWHRRADGDDPAAMILDEFVPLLAASGLTTEKFGLMGQSLGGYGALHIAMLGGASRVAAVGGISPALWDTFESAAFGTFDSKSDFAANTVWGRQGQLAGIPTVIDCGSSDPFAPVVTKFRNSLSPTPAGGINEGCHDFAFASRHAEEQLAFIGRYLVSSSTAAPTS